MVFTLTIRHTVHLIIAIAFQFKQIEIHLNCRCIWRKKRNVEWMNLFTKSRNKNIKSICNHNGWKCDFIRENAITIQIHITLSKQSIKWKQKLYVYCYSPRVLATWVRLLVVNIIIIFFKYLENVSILYVNSNNH